MKARSIEIDGETYSVCRCADCPCYDGGDNGYDERCKHPKGDGKCAEMGGWSKENCEFRQYNPKAEDVFGPSFLIGVILGLIVYIAYHEWKNWR